MIKPLAPSSGKKQDLLRRITELAREKDNAPASADRLDNLIELASRHSVYGTSPSAPVREIMHLVGDKWSSLILCILKSGSCRYSNLRELVSVLSHESTISHRVLTSKLRLLERDGLVIRRVWPSVPPRVEYESSDLGKSLTAIIELLLSWAEGNFDDIQKARVLFDERSETDISETDQ